MDPLLSAALALAACLAYCAYRQRRSLKSHRSVIADRDAEIRRLKSQLTALERDNADIRARHSTNFDVAFDLLLLLDDNLALVMVNRPASRLFAGPNPIGKRLSDVTDSSELLNLVQVALLEEENVEEQFVINGSNYRARAQVINCNKGRRYVGVALQDITDLVNLNRARRDLVANISHELRTPITRIRLIIEGLFLEADKPKRKASIQSLKEIAMETDALLWLAQDLLDLSMIESGEAILRLVKTPLARVVDEAMAQLESQAAMKELSIVSYVPQKYDVLCDADQLKRVFGNLMHNAIKWSPKGEAITVTATEQADEITVSVFDKGPGVPEDLRSRVFERFYQADVSRSGDEGTGLGLAICKHIVEAHGGRIWAEGNSQGKGGHFLFTLLRADASFKQDEAIIESDPPREAVSESLSLN